MERHQLRAGPLRRRRLQRHLLHRRRFALARSRGECQRPTLHRLERSNFRLCANLRSRQHLQRHRLADTPLPGGLPPPRTCAPANAVIDHTPLPGSTIGLAFPAAGATNVMVRANTITAPTGISIAAASSGTLRANNITATTTG